MFDFSRKKFKMRHFSEVEPGLLMFSKERCHHCDWQTFTSKIPFADSVLYQRNLFQNTTGSWHYPPMDPKIFQSQVSFKLEFLSKLNWLFYDLLCL